MNSAGALLDRAVPAESNRNPSLAREDIERRCEMLGVEQIIWLGDGIEGDDTDGHIDDLTRFVAADTA